MGWLALAIFSTILLLIFAAGIPDGTLGIVIALVPLIALSLYYYRRYKRNKWVNPVKEKPKTQMVAKHMDGLPVPQGAECHVVLINGVLHIWRGEQEYKVAWERVTDVLLRTDEEIRRAYVSDAGGAVAGGMLFGALGALIGGSPTERITKTETKYLIFAYEAVEDGETRFISFEVMNEWKAQRFVESFDKAERGMRSVTL